MSEELREYLKGCAQELQASYRGYEKRKQSSAGTAGEHVAKFEATVLMLAAMVDHGEITLEELALEGGLLLDLQGKLKGRRTKAERAIESERQELAIVALAQTLSSEERLSTQW